MATKRKGLPPYLSYRTFRSFIDSVSVGGVPNRIDRSMMASMSGSNQALLVSAIRYLGLASEKGVSTPELESLVNAEGKERQEIWRRILSRAYSNLFNSRINLERATTKELSEVFAKEGVSSADTIRKCVTFFSLAAKDAGVKLSPHIKPYAGRPQRSRRSRAVRIEQKEIATEPTILVSDTDRSSDWQMLLSKFPDFDPSWPEEVRKNWFDGFQSLSKICKGNTTAKDEGSSL
jgi:hypothetical protein